MLYFRLHRQLDNGKLLMNEKFCKIRKEWLRRMYDRFPEPASNDSENQKLSFLIPSLLTDIFV
jgi:hypothetical protein